MKLMYVKTKELIKKRHEQKKKEKEKEKRQNSGFISLSAVDFVQTPFSTSTRRPSKNTECVSISFEGKHRSSENYQVEA